MRLNLIIPCAGSGKRFVNAGYNVYKPFIEINAKAMIDHVIGLFNRNVNVIIVASESHKEDFQVYAESDRINVLYIKDHKNGPAYSICKVRELLKPNEAYFVSYNDIFWAWNFSNFLAFTEQKCPDVAVLTHIGFHPHLFKNNFSAFCRLNGNIISAIKEKDSFTSDWMNEHLSVGGFYFRKGEDLARVVKKLVDDNKRTASEFYPSQSINYLIDEGKQVLPYNVTKFIHWGIPEHIEDFYRWKRVMSDSASQKIDINVCMMLCGTGERMRSISEVNKAGLIVGEDIKMYEYVLSKLGAKNISLIVNDKVNEIVGEKNRKINVKYSTVSQTDSLLHAQEEIKHMKNTLFTSNDCFGKFDIERLKDFNNCDVVLFGFKPSLLQQKQENAHTYFNFDGESVTEILIKTKSDDAYALAGMFYVPDGSIFEYIKDIDVTVDTSFDHFVKYLIEIGKHIKFVKMEDYVHLGTVEEFNEFKYWQKFYNEN